MINHVMFNKCIYVFRPEELKDTPLEPDRIVKGYLLLDFELTQVWDFNYFKVEPTIRVDLPGAYAAFIAPVILPKWVESHYKSHFFAIALSSIFSFVTERPIKAPRDNYFSRAELDERLIVELAMGFPVLTAGPGNHNTRLSQETLQRFYTNINEVINILFDLPYGFYTQIMQSIRLIQLAHLNKRDDFALAYYLLVSGIETITQLAISRKSVAEKHPSEDKWSELAKTDPEIKALLQAYKKERGNSSYLKKRFVVFICKYCPPELWEDMQHRYEDFESYVSEITGRPKNEQLNPKWWHGKYPSDLTSSEIETILQDMYTHRSKFTHEGLAPPHRDPDGSNKFFEEITEYNTDKNGFVKYKEILVPNFSLVAFVAKNSILNYIQEKR